MPLCRTTAAAVLVVFAACGAAPAEPPPVREVNVTINNLRFVPPVTAAQQATIRGEISGFLHTLYTTAFVRPKPQSPTPVPDPFDTARLIERLFEPGAKEAFRKQSGVFTTGEHLDLLHGVVTCSGVVTRQGGDATTLLDVKFSGSASRIDEAAPAVEISQSGKISLHRHEEIWLVREFDLKLKTRKAPPTPTPS